jgi:GNAT superfamily N-acetyltransferase
VRTLADFVVRRAVPGDAAALSALAEVTFFEAYSEIAARQDLEAYIAEKYTTACMSAAIGDPRIDTFMAFIGDEAVGFLQLACAPPPPEGRGRKPLKLDRLYLRRQLWGGPLGPHFMRLSLRIAAERGHDSVWLSVWEKNPRALRFYQRWGFVDIGWEIFPTGNERSIDRLMELLLDGDRAE